MGFRRVTLTILFALMTGCAAAERSTVPDCTYRNSYSFYDLVISWETTSDDRGVTIRGTMKNQSYYYLSDPELTAALMDGDGIIFAQGTFFFFPNQLAMDEIAPFTIKIPVKEKHVPDRIRFTYRYRLTEEGWFGSPHFHSFETKP